MAQTHIRPMGNVLLLERESIEVLAMQKCSCNLRSLTLVGKKKRKCMYIRGILKPLDPKSVNHQNKPGE